MALTAGTRLGPYEILAPLGAGGMGEVYRARDTRLDRSVAIKVLPAHLADRPELRRRFEREARTVSSLNHPNICVLHDIGSENGVDFLVMELLEGTTLADRLTKGALPIPEALRYGTEIADALDRAHRQGVVHRDLKPGNIFLARRSGPSSPPIAKLLDFGLAKTSGPVVGGDRVGPSMAPTIAPLTTEGTILGTPQYMAPEQLEGKDADARTDIFAFGALLYEMVTGRRAFQGHTQVSVIAAIIEHDPPPVSSLQPVSPPVLDDLVKTCLAKSPDDRWQSMRDVLLQLKLIADRSGVSATTAALTGPAPSRLRLAWAAAATLLVASLIMAEMLMAGRRTPAATKLSFQVDIPSLPINFTRSLALSPDGNHLVGIGSSERGTTLQLRPLGSQETRVLFVSQNVGAGSSVYPFWSPDGRFVAFFLIGKLLKVDIVGNPPQELCDAPVGRGGTWNRAGVILFAPAATGPLFQVSDSGGKPVQATELDGSRQETAHRDPYFLPDGKHFLYLAVSSKPENSGIYAGSLNSKERKRLLASGSKADFAAPGHILFMRGTTLMGQRFDPDRLELVGDPFRVAEPVAADPGTGTVGFTVSQQGMLAYQTAASAERHLLWFNRGGGRLGEVGEPSGNSSPALSPDLQHVAVTKTGDIWLLDLVRGGSSRLTSDPALDSTPLWSPDGTRIVFNSNRGGRTFDLYVKNSGGGREELLLKSDYQKYPEDWSPDGRSLLYTEVSPDTGFDLWTVPLTGGRKPQRVVQTPFLDIHGRFSHNGRWIAYASDESGRAEVYVQSFPVTGSKWKVSTAGGAQPRWRHDGKELFFLSLAGEAMAVDISTRKADVLEAGTPRKLFQANPVAVVQGRNSWDVTPDGQRFLINSGGAAPPITVVVNWLAGTK
jgi:serine/threonine protein kinase